MSSRILVSIFIICLVVVSITRLSYAFFNDPAMSINNVFSTGTLNLQLSNNASTFSDDTTATWSKTNMAPGDQTPSATLTLKNTGTIVANHVDISFVDSNSDATNPLDSVMRVTTLSYDGANLLSNLNATTANSAGLIDTDSSGFLELNELASQGLDNHSLQLNDIATNHALTMQLQMSPTASNSYQGATVSTVLTATLQQDASQ